MRQVRITSRDIDIPSDQDCVIAPEDELNLIKQQNMLGGLKPAQAEFKDRKYPTITSKEAKELIKKYHDINTEETHGNA